MKRNKHEEDEEIRKAKANICRGFIAALIVVVLFAVIAFVMIVLMSSMASPLAEMG